MEEAKSSKERYYYWCRTSFNLMRKYTPKHSAYFIFLNKIGFRGMYREGPHGFNVPFGHYKKVPEIFKPKNFSNLKIINMKNNRGHARCNASGLRYINVKEEFDYVIVMDSDGAVSYTHLTLPTIYSV